MIPREEDETEKQAETLVNSKSKEFNSTSRAITTPMAVIDIPSATTNTPSASASLPAQAAATATSLANASTTKTTTTTANSKANAAVVLHVCFNLEATATRHHNQHQHHQHQHHQLHHQSQPPAFTSACLAPKTDLHVQLPLPLPTILDCCSASTLSHWHTSNCNNSFVNSTATTAATAICDNISLNEKKYLADYQRCCPPPLFIIFISLLEIGVFVYDYMTVEPQSELNSTNIPSESVLIYRPDRRLEIWRFISYMFLHANWFHLSFNVVIQLLYGLPLELVHGSLRIAVIYLAGVFAGSLGTSVVDSEVYLVGASGGVYALLAAQLANILLNFAQMRYWISQLVSVVIFVSCDLGYAFYSKYICEEAKVIPSVSYIAHMTGSLAGFTMGLLVLKNFDSKTQSPLISWLALGVFAAFTIFAIAFNLINTMTAQMLEEEGEVIKQHLLHDLGIS